MLPDVTGDRGCGRRSAGEESTLIGPTWRWAAGAEYRGVANRRSNLGRGHGRPLRVVRLQVEAMTANVLLDGPRHLELNRLTIGNPPPKVARGNVDLGHVDEVNPSLRRRHRRIDEVKVDDDSWPAGDAELCTSGDEIRFMPGGQIAQRILAHQENELGRSQAILEQPQGIGRVGRAVALEVNGADFEFRRLGEREAQHREPVRVIADDLPLLVGRTSGGYKQDTVE